MLAFWRRAQAEARSSVLLATGDREERVNLAAFLMRNGYDIETGVSRLDYRGKGSWWKRLLGERPSSRN